MPTYEITTPGGVKLRLTGDKPPSQDDLNQIFLKVGADKSIAGAEAGRQARSEAPTADGSPIWPMRGEDGEQITQEGATQRAVLGGAVATLPGLMAAPVAAMAGGAASYGGGKLAGAVGLPPWMGEVAGGMLGGGTPALGRKALATAETRILSSLSARIAHTLTREAPAAVEAAGEALGASRMAPGASQAARALEGAGLSPELATAEAGKMAGATGEVSANLPGVMTPARGTPALKMPAVAWSQDIQSQVATLRAAGESKAQIIQTLRETYGHKNLPADATEKIVDMIFETGPRVPATAEALPAGSKLAPPYRGGKGLPYTGTPPPRNDAELMQRLRESLDAFKIK